MRSRGSSHAANSGSSTTSQGIGWFTASRMWLTMPSLGMFSAAAIFSLVENLFPTAFPPSRSRKTTVLAWSCSRTLVAEQSSLAVGESTTRASDVTDSLTVMSAG